MPTDWKEITGDSKEKYGLYLCSREWSELKRAVHERAGGKCERCRVNGIDAVHHLTYERKYRERLEDLQANCNGCHDFTHGKSNVDPRPKTHISPAVLDDDGTLLCPVCISSSLYVETTKDGFILGSCMHGHKFHVRMATDDAGFLRFESVYKAIGSNSVPKEQPPVAVPDLKIIGNAVRSCVRCSELASTRTQTVFGSGNPDARIVFIGEAPGADEDVSGVPFVGRAGQLLNEIISACQLKRDDIYITNMLKCRPPGNRTPAEDECANCREYLDGQLAAINPEYIVCWGAVAAQNLLNSPFTIGKLRGKFFQRGRAKVLCTYHPSYLLRNPMAKKDVWQDMQFLMADMGIKIGSRGEEWSLFYSGASAT